MPAERSASEIHSAIENLEALIRNTSDDDTRTRLRADLNKLYAELGRISSREALNGESHTPPPQKPQTPNESGDRDDEYYKARERLRKAAARQRIIGHIKEKTPGTALVFVLAFFVLTFEFSEASDLLQARLGVYLGLIFALFLFGGRNFEMAKRGAIVALVVNVLNWMYRMGLASDLLIGTLSNDVIRTVFMILVLPGFVWYLILLEPDLDVSNKVRWLGGLAIFIVAFSLTFSHITLVEGSLPGGFDTRAAMGDAISNIAIGFGGGFENLMCWIGFDASCGFAGWLNEQLSPFSYDATTVHQIRNERLGAYIRDIRTERTLDITGMGPGQFLSDPVEFTIHAPIPPEIERDLCSTLMTLPAFGDLCSRYSVMISCEVDGVPTTTVEPRGNLTLREVIAQSNTISRCLVQVPSDVSLSGTTAHSSSRQIRVAAEYPFLTTTFRLIRLVDRNALITPEIRRAYESFSEDSIISAGGPVIITTDQNERMAVEHDSTHPITFRLVPQKDTRLTSVHVVALYVPTGMELVDSGPDSTCRFTRVDSGSNNIDSIGNEICSEFVDRDQTSAQFDQCVSACTQGIDPGGCPNSDRTCCEDACVVNYFEHETRDSLGCRDLSSTIVAHFTPVNDSPTRPGSIYLMQADALNRINNELTEDPSLSFRDRIQFWNRQRERDVMIPCTIRVNDKDALLEEGLDVTERTIQAVAGYTVEHAQTAQIRFEGRPRVTSYPTIPRAGGYVPIGFSSPVPVGVVPYEHGRVTITDVFRSPRSGGRLHRGIDLVGQDTKNIVSVWDGIVVEVCRDGILCRGGYGNFVLIQSKQGGMSWDHLYAHFSSIEPNIATGVRVRQGDKIGVEGSTGISTGSHLHFEVRIDGDGLVDPFPLIYDPSRYNDRNLEKALSNMWHSWDRAQEGPPLVEPAYFNRARYSTSTINSQVTGTSGLTRSISCSPTDEQIDAILDAARAYSVPPPVMFAVAAQETNCVHEDSSTPSGLSESHLGAIGMFQIVTSTTRCTDAMDRFGVGASRYPVAHTDFEFHAHCAANILHDKYLDGLRRHNQAPGRSCGSYCECSAGYVQTGYFGWKAAVKGYHGWGCFESEEVGKAYERNVEKMVSRLDSLVSDTDQAARVWNIYG